MSVTFRHQAHSRPGQEPLSIRGAIFDLDGVLTDSSELHYRSWQRLADEEGIPFDREANEALRGLTRRDSLLRVLNGRPATEARMRDLMERKNAYYQESAERITPADLFPGVLALLDELHAAGVRIAIGSASKNARPVIERLGIAGKVDAISDGYSVERHKPAPDLFLHAAEQLGLAPHECVVFEDAAAGVKAALAAGMWVVGLGPRQRVGAAHLVLPGLEGAPWATIKAHLAEAAKERVH